MNNSEERGSGYNDPHSQSFASEEAAAPEKKKSGMMNIIIVVAGILFLGLAGLMGWKMFGGKPQQAAPTPVSAPAQEAAPVEQASSLEDLGMAEPAPADPLDAPVADGQVVDVADPFAPAPVDPIDAPIDAPIAPVDEVVVVDPEASAETVVSPAVEESAAQAAAPEVVQPAPVVEPAPVVQPAPVAAPAPVSVVEPASATGEVMNAVKQEMMGALDRLQAHFERRFEDVERRLTALENRSAAAPAAPRSAAPAQPRQEAARPVARPKPKPKAAAPVARPAPVSENRLEILDQPRVQPPVSRIIIQPQAQEGNRVEVVDAPASAAVVPAPHAETASRPAAPSCTIRSIQPGRVWVRRADGSFATYGVGDTLPGGRKVDSIDPSAGVVADGKPWFCGA